MGETMIIGIGTDIIEIKRIKLAVEKEKVNFLNRIFTQNELDYFNTISKNTNTIAGAFAAKEAVMKAFGTGLRGFNFTDIEIVRNELGKPEVKLYNNAKQLAETKNIKEIHLSISHCKEYATAYVVA